MDPLKLFGYYIFPLIVIVVGTIGNILSLIILSHKTMNKIGPRHMYIYVFLADSVCLIFLLFNVLQVNYGIDLTIISLSGCKIFWYLEIQFSAFSPFFLVYISFEKVISMRYPSKRFFFRNSQNQFIFFLIVFAYNSVGYLQIVYFYTILKVSDNQTNTTILICDVRDDQSRLIAYYFDTINRVYVPFVLMGICSIFLVISIIRLRKRVSESLRSNNHKRFKKDIQLMFSLLVLNFVYILLNLPSIIALITSFSSSFSFFTIYILYSVYGINFFILLINNSLFRQQFITIVKNFFKIFKIKRNKT